MGSGDSGSHPGSIKEVTREMVKVEAATVQAMQPPSRLSSFVLQNKLCQSTLVSHMLFLNLISH